MPCLQEYLVKCRQLKSAGRIHQMKVANGIVKIAENGNFITVLHEKDLFRNFPTFDFK